MVITHNGIQSFRLQVGGMVVAYNPIGKKSKNQSTSFGADIALISMNDVDFNGVETLRVKNKEDGASEVFVIRGPGDYEVSGISIWGFGILSTYGGAERMNTIYRMDIDSMSVVFLGALSDVSAITSDVRERLGNVDILFAPIAGEGLIDPSEAYKLAVSLGSKVVVPMHFKDKKDEALKLFFKEAGQDVELVPKLSLKRKDISEKEGVIIAIAPNG